MANRRRILLSAALVSCITILAWLFIAHTREPVYAGKSLTAWLDEFDNAGLTHQRAETAIRAMGADAVPALLKMVGTKDSRLRESVITFANKHKWFPIHPLMATQIRWRGWRGFHALGPAGKSAIPALIRLLEDDDPDIRGCAAGCLAEFGPDSRDAVPALIRNLHRALARSSLTQWEEMEEESETIALGRIGPAAQPAIPELTRMTNAPAPNGPVAQAALIRIKGESFQPVFEALSDSSSETNWQMAGAAIMLIGTNAEPAVPVLIAALQNTNTDLQLAALDALQRVRSHPELCIPAATPLLQSTYGFIRHDSILLIRAFGPAGKPWFPTAEIVRCLSDSELYVREIATNALREIAPEALPKH